MANLSSSALIENIASGNADPASRSYEIRETVGEYLEFLKTALHTGSDDDRLWHFLEKNKRIVAKSNDGSRYDYSETCMQLLVRFEGVFIDDWATLAHRFAETAEERESLESSKRLAAREALYALCSIAYIAQFRVALPPMRKDSGTEYSPPLYWWGPLPWIGYTLGKLSEYSVRARSRKSVTALGSIGAMWVAYCGWRVQSVADRSNPNYQSLLHAATVLAWGDQNTRTFKIDGVGIQLTPFSGHPHYQETSLKNIHNERYVVFESTARKKDQSSWKLVDSHEFARWNALSKLISIETDLDETYLSFQSDSRKPPNFRATTFYEFLGFHNNAFAAIPIDLCGCDESARSNRYWGGFSEIGKPFARSSPINAIWKAQLCRRETIESPKKASALFGNETSSYAELHKYCEWLLECWDRGDSDNEKYGKSIGDLRAFLPYLWPILVNAKWKEPLASEITIQSFFSEQIRDVLNTLAACLRRTKTLALATVRQMSDRQLREKELHELWTSQYNEIRKLAEAQDATIIFWDEKLLWVDSATNHSVSAAVAVTQDGHGWFKLYNGALTDLLLIELINEMRSSFNENRLMLILDRNPNHAGAIIEYLNEAPWLSLYYIPGKAEETTFSSSRNPASIVLHMGKEYLADKVVGRSPKKPHQICEQACTRLEIADNFFDEAVSDRKMLSELAQLPPESLQGYMEAAS